MRQIPPQELVDVQQDEGDSLGRVVVTFEVGQNIALQPRQQPSRVIVAKHIIKRNQPTDRCQEVFISRSLASVAGNVAPAMKSAKELAFVEPHWSCSSSN